ncbi:MAG: hypothetical protein ACR2P7_05245 [bacterium]
MISLSHYHLAGIASAFFLLLSLTGLALQVRFIQRRKRRFARGELGDERPTSILSLNRFFASYFGFYALMMYGLCLERVNHYLVWPRLIAAGLVLIILYDIMIDRRGAVAKIVFHASVALLLSAALVRMMDADALARAVVAVQALVLLSTALFLQGATHQIVKVRRAGRTGALSLFMHQLFFVKDFATLLFALAMGLAQGWPLLLFNGASLIMQSVVMWHFRWARKSPLSARRRALHQALD